ncbi:MAG TPA: hypothetical protein VKR22_08115, partial [Acidimicrobiales bacterium]|nr:hypothetical protein [Acidimicrobiales bacterium]
MADRRQSGKGKGEDHFVSLPVPPLGSGKDVYYWAADPDGADAGYEDIMLRRVPSPVASRFRGAAGARGLTHAQYLTA